MAPSVSRIVGPQPPPVPNDDTLTTNIRHDERTEAVIRYRPEVFSGAHQLSMSYAPSHRGMGLRLDGGVDRTGKFAGARLETSLSAPVTQRLVIRGRLGFGASYDGRSEQQRHVNLGAGVGLDLRFFPNANHELYVATDLGINATLGFSSTLRQDAVASAQQSLSDLQGGIGTLMNDFTRDLEDVLATIPPELADAVRTELASLSAGLPAAMFDMLKAGDTSALTALIQEVSDGLSGALKDDAATALAAVNNLVDDLGEDAKELVSEELAQLKSEVRDSARAQWALGLGVEAGWRGRIPVWEAKNGRRGGGVYFEPSLSVFAQIPLAGGSPMALLPGNADPTTTRVGVRVSPALSVQIPRTTLSFRLGTFLEVAGARGRDDARFQMDKPGLGFDLGLALRF